MEILIDSEIRNWVFIPIIVIMLLFTFIRINIQKIMTGAQDKTPIKSQEQMDTHILNSTLARAKKFSTNFKLLPAESFLNRKTLYSDENGILKAPQLPAQQPDMQQMMSQNPMFNPSNMTKMMGGNMMMMILFPLQMMGVNYFFSGMLVGKVSFPLTQQFRELLQKGIEIQNIDVKYISSLSLYFLIYLGINKFMEIFVTVNQEDIQNDPMMANPMTAAPPMNPMQGASGQNPIVKSYSDEQQNIKTLSHEFAF